VEENATNCTLMASNFVIHPQILIYAINHNIV